MAEEEGNVLTDIDGNPIKPNGADNLPSAGIITQYVKDLSVENPNAPAVFQWKEQPQIDLQFNIGAEPISDEVNEVELKINLTAKTDQGNAYLVELSYCALIGIRNIPDEQAHAFLYAEAPRLMFPFANRVVTDAIRDAGFPSRPLDPIDFNAIYVQQLQAKKQQEQAAAEGANAPGGNA